MAQDKVILYEIYLTKNPSEALKCLEEIIHEFNEPHYELSGEYSYKNELLRRCEDEVNTIKQALVKSQEQDFNYNEIVIPFLNELAIILGINDIDEMLDKIKEQKKVLKIIFEKNVDIECIKQSNNLDEYNSNSESFIALTEEEFELLKRYFK